MVGIEVDSTAEGSATRWAPGIGITIRGEKVGSEKKRGKKCSQWFSECNSLEHSIGTTIGGKAGISRRFFQPIFCLLFKKCFAIRYLLAIASHPSHPIQTYGRAIKVAKL